MPKVLLVITHGNIGGATNVVVELARGLKAAGADVTVGFGEGNYLEERMNEIGVPVHRFAHLRRSRSPFSLFLFVNELRQLVAAERFDAVQFNSSNTLPGALGAKLADGKVRTVFTVHGLSMLSKNHPASPLIKSVYKLYFKIFLSSVDAPVFVSRHDLDEARRIGLVKQGTVIHNGVDPESIHYLPKAEARKALGQLIGKDLKDVFVIGSLGRLSFEKNQEFVIDMFPDILKAKPDAIFAVLGDGPEHARYDAKIAALGLKDKVFLPGQLDNAAQYLPAFDLFALPSRYEGLPMTLVECTFAGVPSIVSDVGGVRDITPETALYDFNDKESFLAAFARAIKDPAACIPFGIHGEKFTGAEMTGAYLALFEK